MPTEVYSRSGVAEYLGLDKKTAEGQFKCWIDRAMEEQHYVEPEFVSKRTGRDSQEVWFKLWSADQLPVIQDAWKEYLNDLKLLPGIFEERRIERNRKYNREYYLRNKEKVHEKNAEYKVNRDHQAEYAREKEREAAQAKADLAELAERLKKDERRIRRNANEQKRRAKKRAELKAKLEAEKPKPVPIPKPKFTYRPPDIDEGTLEYLDEFDREREEKAMAILMGIK